MTNNESWQTLATDLFNLVLGDFEWVRAQGGRHSVCPLCHATCERDGGPGHQDDCPRFEYAKRFDTALRACAEAPETTPDLERWRTFYQALAWMENDYIGVCGLSTDFTQKHEGLGYAHEGYHNAKRVLHEHKPPVPDGMQQGIRCKCWATEKGPPHTHYDEPPYRCARGCGCKAYEPAIPLRAEAPATDSSQLTKQEFLDMIDAMDALPAAKYGSWAEKLKHIAGVRAEALAPSTDKKSEPEETKDDLSRVPDGDSSESSSPPRKPQRDESDRR